MTPDAVYVMYLIQASDADISEWHPNPQPGSDVPILGYVIPVVYAKLINRKRVVYNTTKYI